MSDWSAPSARPERIVLSDDSDDEAAGRSSTSRRQSHYSSQRVGRTSGESSSRGKGKSVHYDEPSNFANLDESAVPPPVPNIKDSRTYRQQSGLEENIRGQQPTESQAQPPRQSSQRPQSARRRRNVEDEEDLTEVAAPPPVQRAKQTDAPGTVEKQDFLEDEHGGEPDSDKVEPSRQQRKVQDLLPKEPEVPKWRTELYTVSYLIFFAILGTLARLGTQWLTFYPGTPIVTPVIWANFAGSLIMGFLSEDQRLFRPTSYEESNEKDDLADERKAQATKRKKAIPLYMGLATGFCGSYTSFSSFARDFFLAVSNDLPSPINHPHSGPAPLTSYNVSRPDGYSFEAFLHVVISTIALSLGGLIAGAHLAIFLSSVTPRIHGSFIRKFVDPGMVVLGFGCWLGAILLAIFPPRNVWRGEVIFALVFAPLGCLLRFYVSLKLNGLVPSFPLGTFAVNMFGTAIEGMTFDMQHVGVGALGRIGGSVIGCQVQQGILDGFCGCLTTVSTWVAETNGLKRKHGWIYAFTSVIGGLLLLVIIMGGVRWSVGYSFPICNTGYASKIHG